MADYTISGLNNLLKEVYDKEIVKAMRVSFPFLDRFKKWPSQKIGGKKFIVPVKMRLGDSVMAYDEGNPLAPRSGIAEFDQMVIPVRYLSGVFRMTGQAIKASQGDTFSVQEALETAKEDLMEQLHRRQTLDFLGSHTGVRAYVQAAATSATTITIYHPLGWESNHAGFVFKPGDHIYIENTTPVATVVQSITKGATYDTLTVSPAVTVAKDDPIYFGVSGQVEKNLSPHGLADILNNTADYMGLSIATYPEWVPYTMGSPTSPLTLDTTTLADFLQGVRQHGGGNPNVLLCNTNLVAEFIDLYGSQVRQTNPTAIKGGMKSITYVVLDQEVTFFFHDFVPDNTLIALDEKWMYWGIQREGGFLPANGSDVLYRRQGEDMYQADWAKYYNMFTKKRNAHGVLFYTFT